MQAIVKVTKGPLAGKQIELESGSDLLIGREPECGLPIPVDQTVSRRHCQIRFAAPNCILTNLSSNGTRVNGQWVNECKLADRDEIELGENSTLEFSLIGAKATDDQRDDADSHHEPENRVTLELPAARQTTTLQVEQPVLAPSRAVDTHGFPCCLQVVLGPLAGKVVEVKAGKPFVVGRLAECDLCIENDPTVSRRQCQLEFIPPDCHLTDFSTHGTFLNGQTTDKAKLCHDDDIHIGSNTILRVHFAPELQNTSGAAEDSPVAETLEVTRQEFASGLVRFTSTESLPSFAMLIFQIARGYDLQAVIDFTKAGIPHPDDLSEPHYLLDWMPVEAASQISPLMLSPSDTRDLASVIDEAWGADACVLVLSKQAPDDLHNHLRTLATYNAATGRQSDEKTLFAYWWPSLLKPMLEHGQQDLVEHIMAQIDAVLFESDQSDGWHFFATREFAEHLEDLEPVNCRKPK